MEEFEKDFKNYVEVFVGSFLMVFGFSLIQFEEVTKETFPGLMLGSSFLIVGVFYIFKANHDYKKRRKKAKREHMKQHVDTSGEKKITKLPF